MMGHIARALIVIEGDVAIVGDPPDIDSGDNPAKELALFAF
jgi:hypothetical protein